MTDEALLVPTTVGPMAAILTRPDDAPIAGVLVLVGSGGTRSGANQMWVHMARSLRDEGIATLRADYAGVAESWDADIHSIVGSSRELARWFTTQLGGASMVLVCECMGLTSAWAICGDDVNLSGVALIVPPLQPDRSSVRARRSFRRRARLFLVRLRYLRVRRRRRQLEGVDPARAVTEVVERAPTWILTGSTDNCHKPIKAITPDLQRAGAVEVQVVDGLKLNGAKSPEAQTIILDGVIQWVRRCAQSVDEHV